MNKKKLRLFFDQHPEKKEEKSQFNDDDNGQAYTAMIVTR